MSFKEILILLRLTFVTLLFTIVTIGTAGNARELTDLTLEMTSEKSGAEAKQEAFDQATEQATHKLTEELLGPERTARVWAGLRAKLLKNSSRFVLFIKGSVPQQEGNITRMTVSMRFSADNLETFLREEGIMNSGGVRVLPLIEVVDSRGRYLWWADMNEGEGARLQQELFKKLFVHLAARFKAKNIYVLDPTNASFRMSVPAAYRAENLRREDQMLMAQYLKADVVLSGKMIVARPSGEGAEHKLEYDLHLWQSKSGREVGEVQRAESLSSDAPKIVLNAIDQTSVKVADELSTRLGEALAAGNLNLNVVRVSVNGVMSYRQQAEFKRLLSQLREVRVLKERLFEPSKVVFEAETTVAGQDLAKIVQKTRFPLYTIQVEAAQDDSLALNVRALSSASAQ